MTAVCTARSVGAMAEIELAEEAPAVTLDRGDVLVVRLAETATTGYLWRADVDGGLVALDDAAGPGGAAPGAAGWRVLRLRADAPGTWRVDLRLARPWEDAVAQERRVDVTVR
jgi:predicted secreted protein